MSTATAMPTSNNTLNTSTPTSADEAQKKAKKPIRQAVGALVINTETKRVLMLSSRKVEDCYRLPRGNCDEDETPEDAFMRVIYDEAGIKPSGISTVKKLGTYTDANKRGKIVAHHWMYEIEVGKDEVLDSWPALDRQRVWYTLEEATAASTDRHISRLALKSCSLSTSK